MKDAKIVGTLHSVTKGKQGNTIPGIVKAFAKGKVIMPKLLISEYDSGGWALGLPCQPFELVVSYALMNEFV